MDNPAGAPLISPAMMTLLPVAFVRRLLTGATLIVLSTAAPALEPRTWISLDGRTIDAELIKTEGDLVELKDKDNRTLKVPKSSLSFGDLDYIAEYAPEEKKLGFAKATAKAKLPNPAKEMKFVSKTVKKDAGQLKVGETLFKYAETPHFKIFYSKGVDPGDTAELAERLWHDTAFFHASFAGKFKDRRLAVFMADEALDFVKLGAWYVEILVAAGNTVHAAAVSKIWSKLGASSIALPVETAATQGLFPNATVIRMVGRGSPEGTGDNAKGVWGSFRTHVLAGDLMELQAGGVAGFATQGQFAIFTGHSYFKEIDLTGASVTGVFNKDTSKESTASGGYDTGRNWAGELKNRLRKKDVKLNLSVLFASSIDDAKADDLALAYSFSRFLQSTPERHTTYGKLLERINTSNQVPDPDALAKIYDLADGAALEKEWRGYVESGDFR